MWDVLGLFPMLQSLSSHGAPPAFTPRLNQAQCRRSAVATSDSRLLPIELTHCSVHHPLDNLHGSCGAGTLGLPQYSAVPCPQVFAPPWSSPEHHNDLLRPFSTASTQLFEHAKSNGPAAHWAAATVADHLPGGSYSTIPIPDTPAVNFPETTYAEEIKLPSQIGCYGSAPFEFPLDLSHPQSSLSPELYSIRQPPTYARSFPPSNLGIQCLDIDQRFAGIFQTERHRSRHPHRLGACVSRCVVESDGPLGPSETTSCRSPQGVSFRNRKARIEVLAFHLRNARYVGASRKLMPCSNASRYPRRSLQHFLYFLLALTPIARNKPGRDQSKILIMVTITISYEMNRAPIGTSGFKCPHLKCDKQFGRRVEFLRHESSVHLHVKWVCEGCKRKYTRRDNLRRHQRNTPKCKGAGVRKIILDL